MFNFRALFLLSCFSTSGAYHSSPEENDYFDIQDALTNSCKLDINFDSCLMKTFVTLYSNQVGEVAFDLETCSPPNVLESDLVSVFEESRLICVEAGVDIDEETVDTNVSSLMSAFTSDGCLVEACEASKEKISMSSIASELISDVKNVLFETIGICSGVQIDPETCLADFAINQILSGEMTGSEGLLARRILTESTIEPSQPHDGSFLCRAPIIDEDTINNIIEVGNTICGYSNGDADALSQALYTMFSAEGCFMDLCRSIENQTNQIISLLFESVGQCSGVVIDPNSCIISTSLEMLLFGSEGGTGGEHARHLLERQFDFKTAVHEVLEDAKSFCYPPEIDSEMVSHIVQGASIICSENGEDVDIDEIQNVILTIDSLFSEDACWTNLCTNFIDDAQTTIENIVDVPALAAEQVLTCANVEINFDSCIEREMYNEFVNGQASRKLQVKQTTSGLRRKREHFHDFDHTVGRQTEYIEPQKCIIPRPALIEKNTYFAPFIDQCSPTNTDIDIAWNKLQSISGVNGCWESICGESASTFLLFQSVEKCLNFAVPIISELSVSPPLLCMLDFAMRSTDIFDPSTHDHCPDNIAPAAIEYCMDVFIDDGDWNLSMSFSYEYKNEDYSMSYHYGDHSYHYKNENEVFSYYYLYSQTKEDSYSYNYDDDKPYSIMDDDAFENHMDDDAFMKEMNEFINYINYEESSSYSYSYGSSNNSTSDIMSEKLCMLLDQVKSGKGQECLSSLTSAFEGFLSTTFSSIEPSIVSSREPSSVPSLLPSNVPSLSPSTVPSITASTVPSLSPTRVVLIENENNDDDDDDASSAFTKTSTFAILVLYLSMYFMIF